MRDTLVTGFEIREVLEHAIINGYGMHEYAVSTEITDHVSMELEAADYLEDMIERKSTRNFKKEGLGYTVNLHTEINSAICDLTGERRDHLGFFSVRVFAYGENGTTIHRNHPQIGPWAVGVTLKGDAPFNVYEQDVLPDIYGATSPLKGDGSDPVPLQTMSASPGSLWVLYTENEFTPHASGLVDSISPRELLIFYGMHGF